MGTTVKVRVTAYPWEKWDKLPKEERKAETIEGDHRAVEEQRQEDTVKEGVTPSAFQIKLIPTQAQKLKPLGLMRPIGQLLTQLVAAKWFANTSTLSSY
ncbi:hypothetical protein [Synechococcus sp. UW179A]|uniref:hypothetical protein n=1 Tax=Synechococcus sp. UW179A TaxID=2575510 RepID=UPI0010BE8B64|nr:hypothetical protein [Synechococcus sp. UW179A]